MTEQAPVRNEFFSYDNEPPHVCNAPHPRWASVRCINTGKCIAGLFDHHGVVTGSSGRRSFVKWSESDYPEPR